MSFTEVCSICGHVEPGLERDDWRFEWLRADGAGGVYLECPKCGGDLERTEDEPAPASGQKGTSE